MSSFFLSFKTKSGALGKKRKNLSQVKKKRDSKAIKNKKIPLATTIPTDEDEDIPSDSDTENKDYQSLGIDEDFSDREETAPEKRLRLAKDYLQQLKAEERGSSTEEDEDDDVDNDAIGRRLQEKALEKSGRIHKAVADQCTAPPLESIRFFKGHRLSVTSLALTPDGRYAFTGSKDSCIIKWNVEKGVKEVMITRGKEGAPGHTGHVLALAVSTDGMYLASGGTDNLIHMWNPLTCIHLHTFRGHKNSVTGLVFQHGVNQLFSSSLDRTVKVWNISEMTYVETLFGHQDGIIAIDCLSQEHPITAGVDKTIRVWKIIEESHLVYHGHKSSIDTVKMINDKNFVSGSQDGSVALWNSSKKKPQVLKSSSHDSADFG
ncbi:PREDICTED: U3 small nucleolar RNA-interacting protein 2-like isoform X1 [Amphimedon queenslandica]|uniref:Uncharacterized protein n=1 Tax=Amphimedon queenslandica TaxID=400682 RepID=A0A1X7TM33_AMPQE|nr:PREDICTED: U3 small nucleolar RNA-interacting protein 2-like isoform X1 [Amphimedon queenslandica]XP_019858910.1 PREDICTED: U3 small nucleolar RNA-interacting protein 2-like isoform X1 [Amphimedon queenslandica]|eukprot:XP_019858909.1 PREDICTED: U3 small nucleolar RNA-interacting protein 2-like isoform X1 [Amphimedon queenslandica]